ncbi:hypothetical protein C5E10_13780 [Pseudoclavibacter sp. RFBG4]|nr:hypothetical protein C5E10_13780 [Pseudoclavibacter sp. RFBG4]
MTLMADRTVATRQFTLGAGSFTLDERTGAPVQFIDAESPDRQFLLELTSSWHSDEHQWGSGFVITDKGAVRWNAPSDLEWTETSNRAIHPASQDLRIVVERDWENEQLRERYTFLNISDSSMSLRSVGIQTPFNDVYEGASDALAQAVHAHVWTGGAWAWVLAQPMSGQGRTLGLIVRQGALSAYSVESRNPNTLSNARGHIVLHPTDAGRNPSAFGGQTPILLAADEAWTVEWTVGWYDHTEAFIEDTAPPARLDDVAVPWTQPLLIKTSQPVVFESGDVALTDEGAVLRATTPGVHTVRIGDSTTGLLFHAPVSEVVSDRVRYILTRQKALERSGTLSHALVPVNTETFLTQLTNGWSDWTDGSERIGMAILIQQARLRGLVGDDADAALDGWAAFARQHLLDSTAAPRRGSQDHHTGPRLYDAPWLALFFAMRAEHLRAQGAQDRAASELDLAASILERAYELGAERFLAILQSDAVERVANDLEHTGDSRRAAALRNLLVASARSFVAAGRDLPAHEVHYEQSIVAPLTSLLASAYRLTGDEVFLPALEERIDWMMAFGGPQPHARLRDVSIRHWDGYWFGQRRQWGDVFPHYWSTLTAVALLRLPEQMLTPDRRRRADNILAANMANFGRDGWATCAFIFPSTVDSEPAHTADPMANDQDWHLVMWLMLDEWGLAPLR